MSTTTDAGTAAPVRPLRVAALALVAWFIAVLAGTVVLEPTVDVIVLASGRDHALAVVAAAGPARLVDLPQVGVRVRGDHAGFVRDLYRQGAWLVLPARVGGCTGRPRPVSTAR